MSGGAGQEPSSQLGNPAVIHVGDTYSDLRATITAPQADLNLGLKTFLNGTLVSNIVLDTSSVATDTIDYVATDQTGLTDLHPHRPHRGDQQSDRDHNASRSPSANVHHHASDNDRAIVSGRFHL